MKAPRQPRVGQTLLGLVLAIAASTAAAQETSRPFGAGEQLHYRVSFGALGGGTGELRVDATDPIAGELVVLLSFGFDGRAGPFDISHRSRSWLSTRRWASLRYEVEEKVPLRPVSKSVQLSPDARRWTEGRRQGRSETSEPLDELSFLYLLRDLSLVPGSSHRLNRHYDPARNPVLVQVVRSERVRVPAGEFETTYVEMRVRDPARCRGKGVLGINLSQDEARLPVRIVSSCPVEMSLELTATSHSR